MFFSPQTEQVLPEQITLRERDLHAITSHAEISSTYLNYRKEAYAIQPVEVKDIEEETVVPQQKQTQDGKTARVQIASQTIVKPSPVPAPAELEALVDRYAAQYGARKDIMLYIMKCESGYNPSAISPSGSFAGLFQFMASTWSSNRNAMGLDPDPALRTNAEEAIKTAAFKMGRDGYGAWPACSKKAFALLNINN